MILQSELSPIGRIGKPHGINGEMTLILDDVALDAEIDVGELRCVVIDIDGINVPFFIESSRPKSSGSLLVAIDGIDTDVDAKTLAGKIVHSLREDFDPAAMLETEDGFYAADLIGFQAYEEDTLLGVIDDIEDSTENALFIIARADTEETLYIPIADELIVEIDAENRRLYLDLPDGLLEL